MKLFKRAIKYILILAGIILVLNIPVTTRQGINGIVFVKKMPLYVKSCGFLYRDYQYEALSRRITEGIKDDAKKVMAIYDWTVENIKRAPKDFPSVDDHIWDIVVRGYGSADQRSDVFTALASYAGYESFWDKLYIDNNPKCLILSFVKIDNRWQIFDVYNRRTFMSAEDLALPTHNGPTYAEYLRAMDKAKFESGIIRRPDKQKILPRLIYEFRKVFSFIKKK